METRNQTEAANFLLLGFTEEQDLKPLLFGLFLFMLTENLLIILAIISDSHLHMPMYFFLSNLSLADISFTWKTIPKMLPSIQTQNKVTSHAGCFTQIFFFFVFRCLDSFLLTAMTYDCFVAICDPLYCMIIMVSWLCVLLVLGSWCLTVSVPLLETLPLLRFSFCKTIEILHFYCDLPELLKLTYSGTLINNILVYCVTTATGISPVIGILFSYSQIVSSILRISSADDKYKAFFTCGSHLSVVSLLYGTGIGVYLSFAVISSSRKNLVASVMYALVIPMLNPFIYSLRNRDMKRALRRLLH